VLLAESAIHGHGRREIEGSSCAEVTRALVFLASLAIEMGGRVESDTAVPPERPPPPPAAPPRPIDAPALPAPRPPEKSTRWVLSLGAGSRGGLSDRALSPTSEVALGLESAAGRWAMQFALAAGEGHMSRPEGEAWLGIVAGQLRFQPVRLRAGPFSIAPGVGVEGGVVFARGAAIEDARHATKPWLAAEVTMGARLPLGQGWFVEANGGALAPLFRTRYFFQPSTGLYTTPALSYVATLGAGRAW
jgi:hypothetical protein